MSFDEQVQKIALSVERNCALFEQHVKHDEKEADRFRDKLCDLTDLVTATNLTVGKLSQHVVDQDLTNKEKFSGIHKRIDTTNKELSPLTKGYLALVGAGGLVTFAIMVWKGLH